MKNANFVFLSEQHGGGGSTSTRQFLWGGVDVLNNTLTTRINTAVRKNKI